MARMHKRRKGKSGSHRPLRKKPPKWAPSAEEVEDKIVELAKKGYTTSKIGLVLRDQYAVPSVKLVARKKITAILKEKGLLGEGPEDLKNLMQKAIRTSKHLEKNPKDIHNKRSLQLIESKIRRLAKYYRREGRLPEDWKYSLDKAKLFVG